MIERWVGALAQFCARHALGMVLVALAASIGCGFYTASHLAIDTNTGNLVGPDERWHITLNHYRAEFPQFTDSLLLVIDATTPDMADIATTELVADLKTRPDLFPYISAYESSDFFRRNGFLFLSRDELRRVLDASIKAQPFLASLAADPSLRGLVKTLNLALEGLAQHAGDAVQIRPALARMNETALRALAHDATPFSWRSLILGESHDPHATRHVIVTNITRNFSELQPARQALSFARAAFARHHFDAAGATLRLTGETALEDEEFATVAQGMGIALVMSVLLVLALLFFALRSVRTIVATFVTLLLGLVYTLTFAALFIGSLNLISVAFAVMFIGLSIDFGIQFGVRFHQELGENPQRDTIFLRTAGHMARPLVLAAMAIALGFLSFLPTSYRGVSELGMIAGAGMLITLVLNLTLLPALLALLRSGRRHRDMGLSWARPVDRFVIARRGWLLAGWIVAGLIGILSLLNLRFDFNPLHLKDRASESVAALYDIAQDKFYTPYPAVLLASSSDALRLKRAALEKLPEVDAVIGEDSFVPEDQPAKLDMIADARDLLSLSLDPPEIAPSPDAAQLRAAIATMIGALHKVEGIVPEAAPLASSLTRIAAAPDGTVLLFNRQMTRGLAQQIADLKSALEAQPVSADSLPEDLRRDWVAPDGTHLLLAIPSGNSDNSDELARFVRAVARVDPDATGPAVQIYESARDIVASFRIATIAALVAIAVLLYALLRRWRDVSFVVVPLMIAACVTCLIARIFAIELNFANIIALPLLLGIGVAFNIYFVVNWRRGITQPLQTPTARAVFYSALTTMSSFASLAASQHRGTASMGLLLLIGLTVTLAATWFFLPPLMGPPPSREGDVTS
ncbi:MAG TPA: MMPL family transporter [Dongiaceae bacterium]|jgi:hypothetical protein|nr:MMPL family transporter [Dongiaceae bacterium]